MSKTKNPKKSIEKVEKVAPKPKKSALDVKKDKYIKERDALLEKYGLIKRTDIIFPIYNKYPDDLQLALNVINSHKPMYLELFGEKGKDGN